MIRKRFLPLRGLKIITWTIAGVAWVTAAIAGRAAAATAPATTTPTTETTTQAAQSTQQSGVPGLPQDGLIIIRAGSTTGSQQAQPTQQVQQPQQQQVASRVVTQAPVRQRSGGS